MSIDWTIVRNLPRGTVIRLTQEHDAYPDFGIAAGAYLMVTEHTGRWDYTDDSFMFAQLLDQSTSLVDGSAVHWQNVIQFRLPYSPEEAHEFPLGADVVDWSLIISSEERAAIVYLYHLAKIHGEGPMIAWSRGAAHPGSFALACHRTWEDLHHLVPTADFTHRMARIAEEKYLPLYDEREREIEEHAAAPMAETPAPVGHTYEVLVARATLFKVTVEADGADEAVHRAMLMAANLDDSEIADMAVGRSDEFKALVRR